MVCYGSDATNDVSSVKVCDQYTFSFSMKGVKEKYGF
jgi:hypothetical protein